YSFPTRRSSDLVASRVWTALATIESIERDVAGQDARDRALVAALGAAGFLKLFAPEGNVDLRSIVLVREGLAWTSGNADALFAVQGLGTYPIYAFGTEDQKKRLLGDAVSCVGVAAFALTEPE